MFHQVCRCERGKGLEPRDIQVVSALPQRPVRVTMVERLGWRIAVGVLVALMAGAAPALAQPASSPPHSWTGFHVGLNLGYGWGNEAINVSGDPLSEFVITQGVLPPSLADSPSGIVGGVQGGYSYQIGLLVLGLEADAQGADISDRQTVTSNVPGGFFSFSTTAEQKLDMVGTVRGRVGFTPFAPVLVYATGGLAYGHASLSASVTNPGCIGICSEGSTSSMKAGWTAGGGVE